ncbi:hypothetical protein AtEden1_Chr3g0190591 [Arabidopsis thaliana]
MVVTLLLIASDFTNARRQPFSLKLNAKLQTGFKLFHQHATIQSAHVLPPPDGQDQAKSIFF